MKVKNSIVFGLIIAASLSRLVPHAPNFTAVGALALFAGSVWGFSLLALTLPLMTMFLTDLIFGIHPTLAFVYISFVAITALGAYFLKQRKVSKLALMSLATSLLFFTVTNFGVWATTSFYPQNFSGLVECFIMGLPFLKNQVMGDLMFSALLFSSYEVLNRRFVTIK